ncbi:MAG: hypothetical protein NXI13_10140 [Proteobacteria bacterium]|nr:hypothetical protein [Pseudomonadota bacterium]
MPIATVLSLSFGALMVIAVLAVLGISLVSGLKNTRDLLIDKATSAMDTTRGDLMDLLSPAEEEVRYIAELIHGEVLDIEDTEELGDFLLGGVAGTPQIDSLTFIKPNFDIIAANRQAKRIISLNTADDPVAVKTFKALSELTDGAWGPLLYVPQLNDTVLNFGQPIFRNGKFLGALVATIPVSAVNKKLEEIEADDDTKRFVLYGNDSVLLQQVNNVEPTSLDNMESNLSVEGVVPKLEQIDDKVLKNIWSEERDQVELLGEQENLSAHYLQVGNEGYLYFYSVLKGFTDRDLIVGYWVPDKEASAELRRLAIAGMTGLGILIVSAIVAFVLGRKISRPILELSHASQLISELEFEKVTTLPGSRFKEVNEANEAYNTMIRGLMWFETYVPKSLVRKLINSGEARSEERLVTVMFTDIVSFTPQAEGMNSTEVADFLNHHFQLVTACIEEEGGTVDKFIGDAVMAFWGAPELQEDQAARACRSALAIRDAIRADNDERVENGLLPVHMRIGIHSGPLVVGNIGSQGRINYTVVGDTVNIAQRMEQLGKTLEQGLQSDILTLITDATFKSAGDGFTAEEIGDQMVKGRVDSVRIYRLT